VKNPVNQIQPSKDLVSNKNNDMKNYSKNKKSNYSLNEHNNLNKSLTKVIHKSISDFDKENIIRDIKKNFSLNTNQTKLVKNADLLARNKSNWIKEFQVDKKESKFFPYKGINLTEYRTLLRQATSNSNSKISQPFHTILTRISNLFGPSIQKNLVEEVERIRKMNIDQATEEIIRFGEIIKASKKNEKIYWYYFLIVSRVILNGRLIHNKANNTYITKKWDISKNSFNSKRKLNLNEQTVSNNNQSKSKPPRVLAPGEDKNYDDLVLKDQKYSEILKFYRMLAINQILKTKIGFKIEKLFNERRNTTEADQNKTEEKLSYLNIPQHNHSKILRNKQLIFIKKVEHYNSTRKLKFTDIHLNIFLIEKIKKSFLFQELAKFPKGVIHHLHWSAAFYLGDILAGVEKLIDENYNKNLITVIIRGDVYELEVLSRR